MEMNMTIIIVIKNELGQCMGPGSNSKNLVTSVYNDCEILPYNSWTNKKFQKSVVATIIFKKNKWKFIHP